MRYTREQLAEIKRLEEWQDLAHRTKDAYLIEQADRWLRDKKFEFREEWDVKAE